MNLVIEYLLRDKKIENLFELPSSLFVESATDKIVLVFDDTEPINVTSYFLNKHNKNILPEHECFSIKYEEIFLDKRIIRSGYKPIDFIEEPYRHGKRQHADFPEAGYDIMEYSKTVSSILNPHGHCLKRVNWLWEAFAIIYLAKEFEEIYLLAHPNIQRDIVCRQIKPLWKKWLKWTKTMLNLKTEAANELIFIPAYGTKTKKNVVSIYEL